MSGTLRTIKAGRSKVIDDAAMNGPAVSSVIDVRGMNTLKVELFCTRSAYTTITLSATESYLAGMAAGDTCTVTETAAGGATTAATVTYTSSASANICVGLKVALFDYVKLSVGGASAGANDKVTCYVTPVNE
jgi:hypothetical protein